jgi:predicted DCC family thiol-disulfide oxidoreductase YuxK
VDRPILLFDGVCHLCSASVRFVVARDPDARFAFAPIQSELGQSLLRQHGLATLRQHGASRDERWSVVLIEGPHAYTRSRAVLRVLRGLRFPWPLLCALAVIPEPIRDAAYRFVATRRYRWFGRSERCMLPDPSLASRFLA